MRAVLLSLVVAVLVVAGLVNAAAQIAATVASVTRPSDEWYGDAEDLDRAPEASSLSDIVPPPDPPYGLIGRRPGLIQDRVLI